MSVQYSSNFGKVKRSLVNGEAAAIIAPVVSDLTDKIKAATPTLTGETRDSIKNLQHSKFGWTIYTDVEKAIFIEFGTEDTPTFAMFRRSFDANAVSYAKRLEQDFKSHIEANAK